MAECLRAVDAIELMSGLRLGQVIFFNEVMENAVKQEYVDSSQADTYNELCGDRSFSCDSIEIVKKHATEVLPVYMYFLIQIPLNSVFEYSGTGPCWFKSGQRHVD
ncbi:hypothetical protein HOLleu_20177 [Holothuria leucospilota]|uniref:Uncharacterized protein n=1 Tax=Holothuria leucospilota TaxID=206669 RepID=A0A9Q1C0F6_HOLLE|nr:hypothetical protein HOLleu_20177 [Holothuria leucospilota]